MPSPCPRSLLLKQPTYMNVGVVLAGAAAASDVDKSTRVPVTVMTLAMPARKSRRGRDDRLVHMDATIRRTAHRRNPTSGHENDDPHIYQPRGITLGVATERHPPLRRMEVSEPP